MTDLFPLWNSLRISLISTALVIILGVLLAYWVVGLPAKVKALVDVVFTLPLVLPPTVIGFFLLKLLGPKTAIGEFFQAQWSLNLVMQWWSAIFATMVVTFPLIYRSSRASFEAFDWELEAAAQTLGKSQTWIFLRIILPNCRSGIIAGAILTFARALGEYGATSMISGYIPGKTATISTTVYHLWRTGKDSQAYAWVGVNLALSFLVLVLMNQIESRAQANAKS